MKRITAYFVTTDRINALWSLERLNAQGLMRPIVIVRNVRPLSAAYGQSLECPTQFALVVDDDVILEPGVIEPLLQTFQKLRVRRPSLFALRGRTIDELTGEKVSGVGLYDVEILRKVGFPNVPHVTWAQGYLAAEKGYEVAQGKQVIGLHSAGTPRDIYGRYLWLALRISSGQRRPIDFQNLVRRAQKEKSIQLWAACIGFLDGQELAPRRASKDACLVGRIGRVLNWDRLDVRSLKSVVDGRVESMMN